MFKLTREERHELCKTLRRYISECDYSPFIKEGFRIVVNDFEAYGNPDDSKEFQLLKDLIDEAIGVSTPLDFQEIRNVGSRRY